MFTFWLKPEPTPIFSDMRDWFVALTIPDFVVVIFKRQGFV